MDEHRRPTQEELRTILSLLELPHPERAELRPFRAEEDGSEYAVWLVDLDGQRRVLKRAKGMELEVYRSFFPEKKPYVPAFLGSCSLGDESYFLMEYCPGEDLRICRREPLVKALDALIQMQDEFWQRRELYGAAVTLEKALKAAEDRGRWLGSRTLEEAYERFLRLFPTVPRTLCHDDLLPFNLLVGERAVLIDWEYGGLTPYPMSFARLIAHGQEKEGAFFYLSREDREFAIRYYYDALAGKHGIPWEEYRRTLTWFLFYEYCEWVMLGNRYDARDDERYGYYLALAEQTAAGLMN